MSVSVSAAEYARLRGVSKTAVAKAIRTGRISTIAGPDGQRLIDPDRANVEWAANTDIGRQRQGAPQEFEKTQPLARESAARLAGDEPAGTVSEPRPAAAPPASASRPKAGVGAATLLEEKTRSERLRIEKQELDLAERRAELVSIEGIRAAISVKLISARELFESIPDRLAARVAAERDPHVVHRMLKDEIYLAMTMLATVSPDGPH